MILFNGRKITDSCLFQVYRNDLMFYGRLKVRDGDRLYFAQQGIFNYKKNENLYTADGLDEIRDHGLLEKTNIINDIGIYHFHDTSASSPMKAFCNIHNNIELARDGGNISAVLYRIKTRHPDSYEQIIKVIHLVAPYFQDFILRENPINPQMIRLEWRKKGCNIPFGAEQLSDGTLRFICIAVLLCLPENMRKDVIAIDEPELGMHPFAIQVMSELIKKYPNIIMHEYEALLFSDVNCFRSCIGMTNDCIEQLKREISQFPSPEHVNNSEQTAPSKRILRIYNTYQKVIDGTIIAENIGIHKIMEKCKHFSSWVHALQEVL